MTRSAEVHGVLAEVSGVGVLILGRSGVGKSECALDLVDRGHRLVADDLVLLEIGDEGELYGSAPELLEGLLEIRGLGVIDLRRVYGEQAAGGRARIELVVRLLEGQRTEEVERLGAEQETHELLGVRLPYLSLPVTIGCRPAVLVDLAVRSLPWRGEGARKLQKELGRRIGEEEKA